MSSKVKSQLGDSLFWLGSNLTGITLITFKIDVNYIPGKRFLITVDFCTIYLCWVIFISGSKRVQIAHKVSYNSIYLVQLRELVALL